LLAALLFATPARADELSMSGHDVEVSGHRWDWVAVPVPFYSARTSVGVAAAFIVFEDLPVPPGVPRRDDQLKLTLQATVKKQFSLSGDGVLYWRDGDLRLDESATLTRFPNDFWGVGNDAPSDAKDGYTERRVQARTGFSGRVWEQIYVGGQVTLGYYRTTGYSQAGAVADYLMTHPSSGRLIGVGPVIRRDTRDDAIGPHRGSLTSLTGTIFSDKLGSTFVYQYWELDQRLYLPLDDNWGVFAWQLFGRWAPGHPPLDDLPALGGASRLRGYREGRYRDTLYLMTQVEWRVPVWGRFGLAPFGGIGNVFPGAGSFFTEWPKAAVGLGGRYRLIPNRDLNVRVDIAIGIGTWGFNFNVGEAF
jgi:hypothetical protein